MASLRITLSGDRMLGYITGTIEENLSKEEIIQLVNEVIAENGIVYGIQERLIASVALELYEQKKIEGAIVAIGEYPKPEKLAGARFLVPTYPENSLAPKCTADSTVPVPYHTLRGCVPEPYIVKVQEQIGKFRVGEKGQKGNTILGEPQETNTKTQPPDELGQGLLMRYESSDIIATMSGIIVRKKNCAYILPVNCDGSFAIDVSKDRITACLQLYPPGPGGKQIFRGDILKAIENASIVQGIRHDAVDQALDILKKGDLKVQDVCIAEGIPPKPGDDAKVDFQVNLSFSHKPRIMDDGRADYYSIHLFENVVEKQPLATIKPPTGGIPGIDVYGKPVEAPPGKETRVATGKNVEASQSDQMLLVASKTGHVYLRDDNLLVEEVLHIKTDVDFRTGNIDFAGDIDIAGDIKSGFSVKAAGSVCVNGTVEDAFIEAGESVIVRSGFIGKGKGKIKAGGDVVVKHVRNQTIMAKNNIMVDGEVLDAHIFAGNEMFVEVKKSWIVGGVAVARNRVRAYAIGSEAQIPTEVASGIDLFVSKILEELEREILELEKEVKIIITNETRLSSKELSEGELQSERRLLRNQLKRLREEHEQKINQLKKYKSHYKRALYDTKGTIGVIDTIYPGVTLKIGSRRYTVHDAVKKCFFYVHGDMIKSTSLTV